MEPGGRGKGTKTGAKWARRKSKVCRELKKNVIVIILLWYAGLQIDEPFRVLHGKVSHWP